MTTYKVTILFIWTFFSILTTNAENKLAQIKDPDGFLNVRSGKNANSAIVGKIEKGDFFYCEKTKADWLKVVAFEWHDGQQVEGFVHRSRVQFIEALNISTQKKLLTTILLKQKALATTFQETCHSKGKIGYKSAVNELEKHTEVKYAPALEILPKYFSKTQDVELLQVFFSTMWADRGSADETSSFTIGECYILNPSTVLSQVRLLKNKDQRKLIYDHIEWGLQNHFQVDQEEKSSNKEYNVLKMRLDSARKKTSP